MVSTFGKFIYRHSHSIFSTETNLVYPIQSVIALVYLYTDLYLYFIEVADPFLRRSYIAICCWPILVIEICRDFPF